MCYLKLLFVLATEHTLLRVLLNNCLFQEFFLNGSICSTLKTGITLPLFKGKGAKASNKENYRGITLFPTLCKIYEIILLNRLENYASHNQYFSEMQLGFKRVLGALKHPLLY